MYIKFNIHVYTFWSHQLNLDSMTSCNLVKVWDAVYKNGVTTDQLNHNMNLRDIWFHEVRKFLEKIVNWWNDVAGNQKEFLLASQAQQKL